MDLSGYKMLLSGTKTVRLLMKSKLYILSFKTNLRHLSKWANVGNIVAFRGQRFK